MQAYEYRHVVGFEETNLVGNVYYANHIRWQGRCREAFLREYCPTILDEFARGLALVTVRCSCEYFAELLAFDQLLIKMRLGGLSPNRVTMLFEYWRCGPGDSQELVARGEQQVASMWREGSRLRPVPFPHPLPEVFQRYAG